MKTRRLGPFQVSEISLGCMNLSHAYSQPPEAEEGGRLLNQALDLGYSMLDTASLYGFGANESLLGQTLMHRRQEFTLASKCGMFRNEEGVRVISSDPAVLRNNCEDSLRRLNTDAIDIYYLHRWDKRTPVEDAVGGLARLVEEGKIRSIGLSEVSADTLRRAHAVHPIAALQSEYSLWTRNPELGVLDACHELGVTLVAFSPLARAFLTGKLTDTSTLAEKDLRRFMPRFSDENYPQNLRLLGGLQKIAERTGHSMAKLALAWLLARSENIVPIPGTTSIAHLEENAAAAEVTLDDQTLAYMDGLINQYTVQGARYNAATQADVDTEEF